jgi:Regulator of G protein signaling domain
MSYFVLFVFDFLFQVCNFCCRYIDDSDAKKIMIPKFFGDKNNPCMIVDDLISGLAAGPKTYFETSSIEEKNHGMILALTNKVAGQKGALKLASSIEHQNNIRKKYSTIHDLTAHPICCGFLMSFCENEHNSENLSFIRDINEYRELYRDDTGIWTSDWRDTDLVLNDVVTADTIAESLSLPLAEHTEGPWTSRTDLVAAQIAAENIFEKYFLENSPYQVCVSECVVRKTAERMNLLHLYGPSIFDEASIDPTKTMARDVLPRFRASDSIDRMVACVASCEPPPPAAVLIVPAPESLLLLFSSSEPFTSMESIPVTLDEMLTSQQLYTQFSNYLLNAEGTKCNIGEPLKCVRKIDILDDLLATSGNEDPGDQATQIFKYFVAEKSAFEIAISYPERKRVMLSLADPKKGMFSAVRAAALDLIENDFKAFIASDACCRAKESDSKCKKSQFQTPYRPSLMWNNV